MPRDRRRNQSRIPDDVKEFLNARQLASLHQSHYLGWKLAFVRRPPLRDPVFIVHNSAHHLIGILDQDGQINTDVALDIRSADAHYGQTKTACWTEKREGPTLTRRNTDLLLNGKQQRTLERIEKIGWQLNFVRQPLLQQPVAVIISPKGDKLATLEPDGRIKLFPRSNARSEGSSELRPSEPLETRPGDKEAV